MKKVGYNSDFFWHLLMNLKDKYLLKNCWSGPIKNKILMFTTLHFLKKIKKSTWRYHYFTLVYQKSWWYDLQFLRFRVWQTEIGNFRSFLHFYPSKNQTNQNFENEKSCWRYHHFTRVSKITIIWCMVPEIWSKTNKMFCHYGPFYALLPH